MMLDAMASAGYDVSFLPMSTGSSPKDDARLRSLGIALFPYKPTEAWRFRQQDGKCFYQVFIVARRPVFALSLAALQRQCPGTPIIYDTVDLHFLREARAITSQRHSWDFEQTNATNVIEWLEKQRGEVVQQLTVVDVRLIPTLFHTLLRRFRHRVDNEEGARVDIDRQCIVADIDDRTTSSRTHVAQRLSSYCFKCIQGK